MTAIQATESRFIALPSNTETFRGIFVVETRTVYPVSAVYDTVEICSLKLRSLEYGDEDVLIVDIVSLLYCRSIESVLLSKLAEKLSSLLGTID